MAQQVRTNNENIPFFREGTGIDKDAQTLLQDAGRGAVALVFGTLMAKVAASQKWVPFTDEAAVDGSAHPQGILISEDVAGADLVAGDVEDAKILIGGFPCVLDFDQITIENSKLLTTVITVGTTDLRTVEDHLKTLGIFVTQGLIDIDLAENA